MKKYRIVHDFPDGYLVEQRFLFWWKCAVFSSNGDKYKHNSIKEAKTVIEKLKIEGKEVKE